VTTQNQNQNPSTIGTLLQDLRDETTTLFRQEVALAKAEMGRKASQFGAHAVKLATGGFIAYAGLIVLLFGLGDLLAVGLQTLGVSPAIAVWLAPTLIGALVALIGYLMLARAKKAMAAENLMPETTIQTLCENKHWAQTKIRNPHEQQPAL
jgi:Flp pilus assembly protein protease CpaA